MLLHLVKKVPTNVAHNTVILHKCAKGGILRSNYTPPSVHEHGFMLASADTHCFDGVQFRPCSDEVSALGLWRVLRLVKWSPRLAALQVLQLDCLLRCWVGWWGDPGCL